jgi:hypothetical protein
LELTERELGEARVLDRVGWLEKGGSALDMTLWGDYLLVSRGAKGASSTRQRRATMLRKTSAAAAVIAFATAGSALFGGAALAHDGTKAGDGGKGGDIRQNQECNQEATAYNVIKWSFLKESPTSATATNTCTQTQTADASADGGSVFDDGTATY